MCVVVKREMPQPNLRPFKGTFFGNGPVWHTASGLVADCRGGMFVETTLVVTSWFTGDALSAQQTDLTDGAVPVSSATPSWTGLGGVSHAAAYSLSLDATLIRELAGATITVARNVLSVSREGSVLKLALEVQGGAGETDLKTIEVYGRTLQ